MRLASALSLVALVALAALAAAASCSFEPLGVVSGTGDCCSPLECSVGCAP
jgi:hypothetical protein